MKTLIYDHRSNGTVERSVRIVLELLRRHQSAHLGLKRWTLIHEVEKQVNFSFNKEIKLMSLQAWDGGPSILEKIMKRLRIS